MIEETFRNTAVMGIWERKEQTIMLRGEDGHASDRLLRLLCIMQRVAYKPEWKFVVEERLTFGGQYWQGTVWAMRRVTDVETGARITISSQAGMTANTVDAWTDEEIVARIVRALIMNGEIHEMDEWLKLDGVCVKEPHPV